MVFPPLTGIVLQSFLVATLFVMDFQFHFEQYLPLFTPFPLNWFNSAPISVSLLAMFQRQPPPHTALLRFLCVEPFVILHTYCHCNPCPFPLLSSTHYCRSLRVSDPPRLNGFFLFFCVNLLTVCFFLIRSSSHPPRVSLTLGLERTASNSSSYFKGTTLVTLFNCRTISF